MEELTYSMQGDYNLANVTVPKQPKVTLGRYARLRHTYLEEHDIVNYSLLIMSCKLAEHLAEVQERAFALEESLMAQMKPKEGITEELKMNDMMEWVRRMNNLRNRIQEIVLAEVVYV